MGQSYTEVLRAQVVDNQDPELRGRLKVRCAALLPDETELPEWLDPCFPYADNKAIAGWFAVPGPGTEVELELVTGSSDDAVAGLSTMVGGAYKWRAALYPTTESVPQDFRTNYGKRLGLRTPEGQLLIFDDKLGELILGVVGKLRLGSYESGHPIVLGDVFKDMMGTLLGALAAHKHPLAGAVIMLGAPTVPPTPVMTGIPLPIVIPPGTPPVPPMTGAPDNASTYTDLKASPIDDETVLSKRVFADE